MDGKDPKSINCHCTYMRKRMKVAVILAHPGKGSFNHAIASDVVSTLHECGHEVKFHDLYTERFDPLLPHMEISRDAALPPIIAEHCREIASADGIVIVHPNWWGMPPAILKGWIDRILRPVVAYWFEETDSSEGVPLVLLKARAVIIFNTSNTPALRERVVFGDPLDNVWRNCIASFCGVPHFYRMMCGVIVVSTEEQRKEWLSEVRELVHRTFTPDSG
jgi:NAD(P)H dehydrogenase (quinone)